MNFKQKKIERYCASMSTTPSDLITELERETHLKTLAPQMLTGQTQGLLLQFIAQMIQPECILEIGTFTGYSAHCMAKGLVENGMIHTIEINKERLPIIEKYINKGNLSDKIKVHIGDARFVIPKLNLIFDLVYIDAAKFDYKDYYNLIIDKVRSGGMLVVDNVLWGGKVVEDRQDKDTQILHAFNEMIQLDPRVENVILPIRDGITLIRKL